MARPRKPITLPEEYTPGRWVPPAKSKHDKEAHLAVPLHTLSPGQHFRVTNSPDRPSWEGIVLNVSFGGVRIRRLGAPTEKGTRSPGETTVIAATSPVIKLAKTSPQYATEIA